MQAIIEWLTPLVEAVVHLIALIMKSMLHPIPRLDTLVLNAEVVTIEENGDVAATGRELFSTPAGIRVHGDHVLITVNYAPDHPKKLLTINNKDHGFRVNIGIENGRLRNRPFACIYDATPRNLHKQLGGSGCMFKVCLQSLPMDDDPHGWAEAKFVKNALRLLVIKLPIKDAQEALDRMLS